MTPLKRKHIPWVIAVAIVLVIIAIWRALHA